MPRDTYNLWHNHFEIFQVCDDLLCSLATVHLRHVAIHQDELIGVALFGPILYHLYGFESIGCRVNAILEIEVFQMGGCTLGDNLDGVDVERFVIDDQDAVRDNQRIVSWYRSWRCIIKVDFLEESTFLVGGVDDAWQVVHQVVGQFIFAEHKSVKVSLLIIFVDRVLIQRIVFAQVLLCVNLGFIHSHNLVICVH